MDRARIRVRAILFLEGGDSSSFIKTMQLLLMKESYN